MLALAPFTLFADNTTSANAVPPAQEEAPKAKLVLTGSSRSGRTVRFYFSSAVTKDAFDKSVSVTPAIKFETTQEYASCFSVSADFVPGETYAVRIDGSLAGTETSALGEAASVAFIADDLSTELDCLTDGELFPLGAPDFSLPVQARNTGKLRITTRQAYDDSLIRFFRRSWDSDYSKKVFSAELDPQMRRNEYGRYSIDLEKIGIPRKPGVYRITIEAETPNSWYKRRDIRTVIITDLAIQAARNGEELAVAVKSISGNAFVPGAKISIYSSKERLVASAQCDADGFAKILLPQLDDSEDHPAFVLAENGEDRSLLSLSDLNVARQDRDFGKPGAQAHVFPERGICRPGESIHLFASLRDENKRARGGVPAEFCVSDPRGDSLVRIPVVGDAFGFYKATVDIPEFAATGTYRAKLRIPGQEETSFGSTHFSVGEYVPDSLDVSVKATHDANTIRASGNAAYYFGMPLDGGQIRFELDLRFKRFVPKGDAFKQFLFGFMPPSLNFQSPRPTVISDAQGNFETTFELPDAEVYPAILRAAVSASAASSAGGRSVSASDSTEIHTAEFYFGTSEKSVSAQERVFDICTLAPDSSRVSLAGKKFKATLVRKAWNYVLRESNGHASFVWQEECIPAGEFEFDGGSESITVPVPRGGNYELEIASAEGACPVVHKREFWHYYGETGTRSRNASQLAFRLDREKYLPGETAKISFDSPFAGNAVLLAGAEKIETMQQVQIRIGENTFEIPIPDNALSGSRFFSVTASGATEAGSAELVQRTFGVGVLPIDQDVRKIFVKTELPEITRPGEKTSVRVRLSDASGKPVAGKVQLWAVDRGVLSLTGFKTPDSFSYFFGTYACPYAFGDNYDEFYPLLSLDRKLFGGGAGGGLAKFLDGSDQSKESAVVVLETLDVPASGEASAEIIPPDFDGAMRLMAFAVNEEKAGSGDDDFIVREPVSLKVTAPRAVAPGDTFEVLAEVFNTDLPEQDFAWELSLGGKKFSGTARLKKGEKCVVRENVVAGTDCGVQTAELSLRDASGKVCSQETVSVSIRTLLPPHDLVEISEIAPGQEAHFENTNPFGEVALGSPLLAIAGALDWLEEYPYGCLEQVSAATFPLLATKTLAETGVVSGVFVESSATKIRSGLARISAMRRYDGMYSMWPHGNESWDSGSLFAFHLELEADANGFTLPEERRNAIRRALMKISDSKKSPVAQRAYAIYLLALSGEKRAASFAKLYLYENIGDEFSRFLVGTALVESGYAAEGMKTILPILEKDFWAKEPGNWDSCLDSKIRRAGLALHILAKIAPEAPANKTIARYLQTSIQKDGHWGSTQKNAWACYGLASYVAREGNGIERAIVTVDGENAELEGVMKIAGGKRVSVKNVGERPISCFVRTREKPKNFEPVANGFTITREYLDASGMPVSSCKPGDLLTVKIRVKADEHVPSAVICDLLPGGLEIEDETLVTRVRTAPLKRDDSGGFRELVRERRFDRFLAFGTSYATDTYTELTYRVRATARGKFAIPPVQVESMYEGEKRAAWAPEQKVFEIKD